MDDTDLPYVPVRLDVDAEIQHAMQRPGFREAWDNLDETYQTLEIFLTARKNAGLSQEDVAQRMGTTRSAVCRLEASLRNDKGTPSLETLRKYAHACGRKLVMRIV